MTSGINEANRITHTPSEPPQRLEGVPEDLNADTVDEIQAAFTQQFGTRELLEWARWYKENRRPQATAADFEEWWDQPGTKGYVISMIVMTGVGSSYGDAELPMIGRLLEWYGLSDG